MHTSPVVQSLLNLSRRIQSWSSTLRKPEPAALTSLYVTPSLSSKLDAAYIGSQVQATAATKE